MKPRVCVVTIGHVDHGKSTLLGRLLVETGVVSAEEVARNERQAQLIGKSSFKSRRRRARRFAPRFNFANKPTTPTTPSEQLKADESKDACNDSSRLRSERLQVDISSDGGDAALRAYMLMECTMVGGALQCPAKAAWENGERFEKGNQSSLFS